MADVSITLVKQLREKTQAGMMDCKAALEEAGGEIEKAEEILRIKRKTIAEKKGETRQAGHGVVGTYTHGGGRIGVMVELRCETDFVAMNDSFQELLKDLCLQVAASNPSVVERSEVDQAAVEKEREILTTQLHEEGKPEERIPQILEGMMEKKFYKENVLLEQPFIKEPKMSVGELVADVSGKTGEKIVVRRIARFEA